MLFNNESQADKLKNQWADGYDKGFTRAMKDLEKKYNQGIANMRIQHAKEIRQLKEQLDDAQSLIEENMTSNLLVFKDFELFLGFAEGMEDLQTRRG